MHSHSHGPLGHGAMPRAAVSLADRLRSGAVGATLGGALFYRADQANHCPGCGGLSWHVGRVTAECAQCLTALPLQTNGRDAIGIFSRRAIPIDGLDAAA